MRKLSQPPVLFEAAQIASCPWLVRVFLPKKVTRENFTISGYWELTVEFLEHFLGGSDAVILGFLENGDAA
jgi:hypothetical protein